LIGPNGAGKSTTFNMVNGQLRPDSGFVRLDGIDLVGLKPRQIWQMGVSRTFQIAETFASLTVVENVQMTLLSADNLAFALWRRASAHRRGDALELLAQVGLAEQADRPCSQLAYGDVKRLELAIALANQPRLLLMDEPTAGMAPAERVKLMALTRQLVSQRGLAVLFTEHSMDVVLPKVPHKTYATTPKCRKSILAPAKPSRPSHECRPVVANPWPQCLVWRGPDFV
jgi:branched-chain amino acid transport system ATP-binding protein